MVAFELEKGSKFQIEKGVRRVRVGLGWDDTGENFDPDASALGLVHIAGGKAVFYGEGSHAVCYANAHLKHPDGTIQSPDGSIIHSGDNRTGSGADSEVITIDLTKVPNDLAEIAIWVTIYHARERKQNFGMMKNCYIAVTDADSNAKLGEYRLRDEFGSALAVQVGSFVRNETGVWEFIAVGAGAAAEIGDILAKYE